MGQSGDRNSGITGVVINYFNPSDDKALYYQTLLSASSYRENGNCIVCISDGSGFDNKRLSREASLLNVVYIFSLSKLSFSEGYNQGINYFKDIPEVEYLILSANDIIASKDCIQQLLICFRKYPRVGCAMPYLTNSDYFIQNSKYKFKTRVVPIMTLNCNLFLKSDLLMTGMVPTYLSGYFNDIVMASRFFAIGKEIYLVKNVVLYHLVSRTIAVSSSAKYDVDKKIFMERHPDLTYPGEFLIRAKKFSSRKLELVFSFFAGLTNAKWYYCIMAGIYKFVFDFEAFLYGIAVRLVPLSVVERFKGESK